MLIKIIKRVESGVDDNIALAKTLFKGSLNLVLLTLETFTSFSHFTFPEALQVLCSLQDSCMAREMLLEMHHVSR
jgi:hypothetical protein